MSYKIANILYATELEPRSPEVFRHAVGIARQFDARLHILTVSQFREQPLITDFISWDDLERIHTEMVQKLRDRLWERIDAFCTAHADLEARSVIADIHIREGNASQCILDMARKIPAGLIVLGSHGHTAIGEMLIGSVAHKVTMNAEVPVLLVPINR